MSLKDIKGCIPISGVFMVGGGKGASEIWGDDADLRKKASPMVHVAKDLPPMLIFYADKELGGLGKQAEAFTAAIKKLDGKVEVRMIKDRDHGTIMRNAAKADDEVKVAMVAFIKSGKLPEKAKEKEEKK